MKKEEKEEVKIELTEQQKKILEEVKEKSSFSNILLEHISLHKDNLDDYYGVLYNYMGTGVHIPKDEVDEMDYIKNGIKVYHTCTYIF